MIIVLVKGGAAQYEPNVASLVRDRRAIELAHGHLRWLSSWPFGHCYAIVPLIHTTYSLSTGH